ncbi:SCO family protein [Piscinibacter sp. Jin2]|uniref:SCO family protein n=1 Tax=Aquariibacter lacus TaxID=2801332 RepID=A0A9X1BQS8_9BURK|nr:SCO family protein [Piscinibacter lacus]MBL0719209.1 SCO family protein [Piscinibacter lacus]
MKLSVACHPRLRLLAAGLLIALGASLAGCDDAGGPGSAAPQAGSSSFKAVDITGLDYGKSLKLSDPEGQLRSLADYAGKLVVVFFGYTQCPDVCPTTMAELAQVKKQLGAEGDKLQAIFVTVDPERDSAELLKAYMASFDPAFVALRGTLDETKAVAQGFKVFYQKVPNKDGNEGYTLDHTAGAYVFDMQGRTRLFVRYGTPIEAWLADLRILLAGG